MRRYSDGDMPVCLRKKRLNEDCEENPLCLTTSFIVMSAFLRSVFIPIMV